MFDIPQSVTALHSFAQTHYEALQNAALLLGGPSWLRRAQSLLDELAQHQPVTRRTVSEAISLLSLLALDNVHQLDSIEAACFAQLDPGGPHVAEICLLTEALGDALAEMGAVKLDSYGCVEELYDV